jgi:hypothetical protein
MGVTGFWTSVACFDVQAKRLSERVIVIADESSLMKVISVATASQKGIVVIDTQRAPSIAMKRGKS